MQKSIIFRMYITDFSWKAASEIKKKKNVVDASRVK